MMNELNAIGLVDANAGYVWLMDNLGTARDECSVSVDPPVIVDQSWYVRFNIAVKTSNDYPIIHVCGKFV